LIWWGSPGTLSRPMGGAKPMPFPVELTGSTASPSQVHIAAEVRTAINREAAKLDAGGLVLRTADGAEFQLTGDGSSFLINQFSPDLCQLIFDVARRTNSFVDRGGSDVTPLQMKGSSGSMRYVRMHTDVLASPNELCARLRGDLASGTNSSEKGKLWAWSDRTKSFWNPPRDLATNRASPRTRPRSPITVRPCFKSGTSSTARRPFASSSLGALNGEWSGVRMSSTGSIPASRLDGFVTSNRTQTGSRWKCDLFRCLIRRSPSAH
jgi:hypothetical protein